MQLHHALWRLAALRRRAGGYLTSDDRARLEAAFQLALVNFRMWRSVLVDLPPFERVLIRQECEAMLEGLRELEARERGRAH